MFHRRVLIIALTLAAACGSHSDTPPGGGVGWSRTPPGPRPANQIPQLVSITFEDNFGLAYPSSTGCVKAVVDFYHGKMNPAGAGNALDFDGAPIAATFFDTSIYLVDDARTVLGGKPGEDHMGRNRAAWSAAASDGHEAADHTVNHFNGGVVNLDVDDCCRARDWSVDDWKAEIGACRDALADPGTGVGVTAAEVSGFRTPFLGYNDHAFTALTQLGFAYDSTLPNCFAADEDGGNCAWPYTLDHGSPDADVLGRDFARPDGAPKVSFPAVAAHAGLWELPPTTLVVPPDSAAAQYHFTPGLRDRIAQYAPMPYPSIYDGARGKIAGLDYTLLMDAKVTGDEMAAILAYNLDLHLAGNRSPLIFIAHSHLYAYSSPDDNPDTPSPAERDARWKGLTDFINYAMSKPEVRIVATRDVLAWVQRASAQSPK
jgi:hypothetical protein